MWLFYSINTPLLNDNEIVQIVNENSVPIWLWYSCAILLLGGAIFLFYRIKHNRVGVRVEDIKEDTARMEAVVNETIEGVEVVKNILIVVAQQYLCWVHLMFRDKDGNDITGAFTPRLKSLLNYYLCLYGKN